MVIWTCVLAVIFIWNVIGNFVFADFDTNLLLLMGIASSTYLGFKMSGEIAGKSSGAGRSRRIRGR